MFARNNRNPLITPQAVRPSRPDFEVIGTFNAGVAIFQKEIILLLRVAERPMQDDARYILTPQLSHNGTMIIRKIDRHDERYRVSDPRIVYDLHTGDALLTSTSHLRLARSRDGYDFTIEEGPWFNPQTEYETFGVEDARVSQIDDTYYVNYSAVSKHGISTSLASTGDFVHLERHGIIFPPANRDVTLFPERINGRYVCYHRPMPGMFGGLNIWLATSSDLLSWGQHQLVLEKLPDGWEAGRVGGGAPPLRTEHGWLSIYHAADRQDRYCLGAFLTPLDEPGRVIARSRQPIFSPDASYETQGFCPDVVFCCGALVQDGQVRIYYGASDEVIGLAETSLENILDALS